MNKIKITIQELIEERYIQSQGPIKKKITKHTKVHRGFDNKLDCSE